MLVELLAQQTHRRPHPSPSLKSRLHPDGANVPVGLIEIVSGEDRSKVHEAIGSGALLRRRVQGPDIRRQPRSHAVAGFDGEATPRTQSPRRTPATLAPSREPANML